jgi:broad specificity phosphatase PhoE
VNVFAIRHGETEWSLSGQHTGTTDIPLTDNGRRLAEQMRPVLAKQTFALVLVSPMQRARETCALAGLGDIAVIDSDLAEWNYGEYEGLTAKQIHEMVPGWLIFRDGCPGGEAPEQVAARVDRVIAPARGADGDVALFSPRTRAARTRSALDRVASGRRAAFLAQYGHAVRARLLPRHTRCEGLERASPRLAHVNRADLRPVVRLRISFGNRRAIDAAARE